MSDGFNIKALRERAVVRPDSHSATRFGPFVDVQEDEWIALLDAIEALRECDAIALNGDDHRIPDPLARLDAIDAIARAVLVRFDFDSAASR